MLQLHLYDEELSDFFYDYWQMNEKQKFVYSVKAISEKYNIRSETTLQKMNGKSGIANLTDPELACYVCQSPYDLVNRSQLSELLKKQKFKDLDRLRPCNKCQLAEKINTVKYSHSVIKPHLINFNKLYRKNSQKSDDHLQTLNSLNLIELITLFVIYTKIKPSYMGKVGPLVFPRFMHEEFYKENAVIQSLVTKGLIAHTIGIPIYEELHSMKFEYSGYKREKTHNSILTDIFNDYLQYNSNIQNLVWLPRGHSSASFSKLVLGKIESYQIQFKDIEYLTAFLKNKRKNEILLLIDTINFNEGFKLKSQLSVKEKLQYLQDTCNLYNIYAHLKAAINRASFMMDSYPDNKRNYLKNSIYTNCLISEKNHTTFEHVLSKNLRKSHIVNFLETNYNLRNQWFELPVNEFIKRLIQAIDNTSDNVFR